MNRFVIGGILAAIVVMLTGGLNKLLSDRSQGSQVLSQRNAAAQGDNSDLGTLPLDKAGQLVQRQSDVGSNGVSASSDTVFNTNNPSGTGMPPGGRATISPTTTGGAGTVAPQSGNVIPRTGAAATFPANPGDIAPIQPGLVRPGVEQQRPADPDVDSIPALW
ncbi:hypothetical protein [Nodosilinea nodulosa]|uniref:hypothetical protein n=1 Tax=Nodosilinea nodulosa TaxID=416001 RepID=UPI000314A4BB|nr:hypothetical protein [Nodosilinea nodulosa]